MKTENVLVYFESTPDCHEGICGYGIMVGRLDQYLKALGQHGLDELLADMDVVREKIISEYYPAAQKESEAAGRQETLCSTCTKAGVSCPIYPQDVNPREGRTVNVCVEYSEAVRPARVCCKCGVALPPPPPGPQNPPPYSCAADECRGEAAKIRRLLTGVA